MTIKLVRNVAVLLVAMVALSSLLQHRSFGVPRDTDEATPASSPNPAGRDHTRTTAESVLSKPPAVLSTPTLETSFWSPTECMPTTHLMDPRLGIKCGAGKIARRYCDDIAAVTKWRSAGSAPALQPATCGQPSRGRFRQPLSDSDLRLPSRPDCPRSALSRVLRPREGDVAFVGPDDTGADLREDAPTTPVLEHRVAGGSNNNSKDGHCASFRYFTSLEALAVLRHAANGGSNIRVDTTNSDAPQRGRGILFTGDSMMRQLWLRLVALLRGQRFISEHYFHHDGLYVLRRTGDAIIPLANDADKEVPSVRLVLDAFFPGYLRRPKKPLSLFDANGDDDGGEVLLAMLFLWDPKPSTFRVDFRAIKPYVHIASFMYWWSNKEPVRQIDPYVAATEELWKSLPSEEAEKTKFVFLTTPETAPKTFGGVEAENRLPRNALVADWMLRQTTDAGTAAGGRRGPSKLLLDFSGIAAARAMTKTVDAIHYMCIWTPKLGTVTNNQKNNGRGCTEAMNLAVSQWLLHLLLVEA